MSPSTVIFRRCCACRRVRTSSGKLGLVATFQRSTALDDTLLTFWPPGPPERTKLHSNSSSWIAIVALTSSMAGFPFAEFRLTDLAKHSTIRPTSPFLRTHEDE